MVDEMTALLARIDALEKDRASLFRMVTEAATTISEMRKAGMQPATALVDFETRFAAERTRINAEIQRLDYKIDSAYARDELSANFTYLLRGESRQRPPAAFDPATATCSFCSRVLANAHGRAAHENRCDKNPATALQAWVCKCGVEGVSNTGLGRHTRKCTLGVVDRMLMRPEPTPAPGVPIGPMPLTDAIRNMIATGETGAVNG